jgi:transcriptional regulator with XRE-family HTH domain
MPGRGELVQRQVLRGQDKAELEGARSAFGESIRSLRKAAGLSQARLAARCLVPEWAMSDIERGRAAPSFLVQLWLARALDVPGGRLVEGLQAPSLSVSTTSILALLAQQPRLGGDKIANALDLPYTYVVRIIRYLEAYGVIVRKGHGWEVAPG